MTAIEKTKRIDSALKETKRLLNKELSYSEDLQNKEEISFLRGHIDKLNRMKEA